MRSSLLLLRQSRRIIFSSGFGPDLLAGWILGPFSVCFRQEDVAQTDVALSKLDLPERL